VVCGASIPDAEQLAAVEAVSRPERPGRHCRSGEISRMLVRCVGQCRLGGEVDFSRDADAGNRCGTLQVIFGLCRRS
jgi:hypothetical protein